MFVHFLPLILASITLSFLVLDPERTPGWLELSFLQFNSFLFLGSVLLGQMIPWFSRLKRNENHGSFTSSHLSPSRILNWLLWFWLIHAGTPDFWIRNNLQWDFPMESISIFLLLISYLDRRCIIVKSYQTTRNPGFERKSQNVVQAFTYPASYSFAGNP